MNSKIAVSTLVVGLIASAPGSAMPIDPTNDRSPQVVVGSTGDTAAGTCSPAADCELQTLIELALGVPVDVTTDQQSTGMWQLTGLNPAALPIFTFEVTANAATQQLGIWSDSNGDTDPDGRTLVDIFLGTATGDNDGGDTIAVLAFEGGNLEISGGTGVNEGIFAGIDPGAFGFYLQPGGDDDTWFSLDQLNGGSTQMLAFRDTNANRWALAFEDLLYGSDASDDDFNDAIFTIESIVPVPEPGTLLLFGSGILALGLRWGARRRTLV